MIGKGYPCPKCSKLCKSPACVIAHIRLEHAEEKRKTYPDEVGERLTALEKMVATTGNPEKVIESEEELRKVVTSLLPAIEKYGLAVCCFEKAYSYDLKTAEYRVVKNSQIESFGLGSNKVAVVVD